MTEGMADLKQLERDAFRRFYEDGVFDIYIGAMLLVIAVAAVLESLEDELLLYIGTLGLALVVTVPLLYFRRRLLVERLGTFEPGPRRKLRISRTRWVMLGSFVLGLVMFVIGAVAYAGVGSADVLALVVPIVWFLNAAIVFGATAYFLDVPRFYAYGIVGGLLMPLMVWSDVLWDVRIAPWLIFGTAGLAVIAVGIHKLRRFLQQYPRPATH